MSETASKKGALGKGLARLRPFLDLLPASILCLVALFEIVSSLRAGSDTGSSAEWQRAADRVHEQWKVGDLVVFAPEWIDPVGRQYLGPLLTLDDAGRMDADRYQVVWELAIRGARAAETRGREASESFEVGPIRVTRWVGEPAIVVTDFAKALEVATVTGSARPRRSLEEVGFAPHNCALVVPRPNETIEVAFAEAEVGSRIVGYAGLADVFTRRDVRDPGRLELVVNGSVAADITLGVEDGWVRFEAPTRPGAANVTFRLTAVGAKATDRRICFAAEARR